MALPTTTPGSWIRNMDFPSQFFEPGEIEVRWDDGMLNVAPDHDDPERNRRRTCHRRVRFPKRVEDESISARHTNGLLAVRLPVTQGVAAR